MQQWMPSRIGFSPPCPAPLLNINWSFFVLFAFPRTGHGVKFPSGRFSLAQRKPFFAHGSVSMQVGVYAGYALYLHIAILGKKNPATSAGQTSNQGKHS